MIASMEDRIIAEFRANEGSVGDMHEGKPLLLLHSVGARTGITRVCALMYGTAPGGYAIFASKGGADTDPHWFHNLIMHPDVEIEIGSETLAVRARVVEGQERERIWSEWKRDWPFFAEYERKTKRPVIPVVVLERV